MRHAGKITISLEMLKDLIFLPEDAEIRALYMDWQRPNVAFIIVEHPDLPKLPEASLPLEVTPLYITHYSAPDENGKVWKESEFVEWTSQS